jgi:hypothetical protein
MKTMVLLVLMSGPTQLSYSAPEAPDAPVADYEITEWKAGDVLYVANDEANLRAAASAEAVVAATLPLGARVQVAEVATERVRVQDRVDRWYRVEATLADGRTAAGFLFGNVLTPYRFAADFDGDGEEEIATVGFTADFQIRVRFLEPAVKGKQRVAWVDARPTGGAYVSRRGGNVSASLVPATVAGIALVKLESRIEACGDYGDYYVSYTAAAPRKTRGAPGKAQLALSLFGLSDPPSSSSFKVKFLPKQRQAVVDRKTSSEDEEGKEVVEKSVQRYALQAGVFVEKQENK